MSTPDNTTDPLPICVACGDLIAAGDDTIGVHGAASSWTPAGPAATEPTPARQAEYAVATALGRLTGSVADLAAAITAGDYARAVQILRRGVDEVWDDAVVIDAQQAVVTIDDPALDTDVAPWLMVQISAVITAWHLAVDDAVAGDYGAMARAIGYMEVIVR